MCIHGGSGTTRWCIIFKSTCTPQSPIDDVLNDDVFNRHGIPQKTGKKIALHFEKIEKDKHGNLACVQWKTSSVCDWNCDSAAGKTSLTLLVVYLF